MASGNNNVLFATSKETMTLPDLIPVTFPVNVDNRYFLTTTIHTNMIANPEAR
jgi:hypothetical protein